MKLKLNPSSPMLFEPSHCHTASLTSSSEKVAISLALSSSNTNLNSAAPNLTHKPFVAYNYSHNYCVGSCNR